MEVSIISLILNVNIYVTLSVAIYDYFVLKLLQLQIWRSLDKTCVPVVVSCAWWCFMVTSDFQPHKKLVMYIPVPVLQPSYIFPGALCVFSGEWY
jgi:hypothetical protein